MDYHSFISYDLSPDGKSIVFSAGDGRLYGYHLKEKRLRDFAFDFKLAKFPRFAPDGNSIVFQALEEGRSERESEPGIKGSVLCHMNVGAKKASPLFPPSGYLDSRPFFLSDSGEIGFVRAHTWGDYRPDGSHVTGKRWKDLDFYLADVASAKPVRVTHYNLPGGGVVPTSGPLSKKAITFTDPWIPESTVYVVNSENQQIKTWHNFTKPGDTNSIWDMAIFPDRTKAVIYADFDVIFNFNLYLVDMLTKKISMILKAKQEQFYNLTVSPDGQLIYFLHQYRDENRPNITLQRIDRDGKNRQIVLAHHILQTPK